jgi:mRNA interferase MazF
MKGKVVLVSFPFDDLSSSKVRPAVCLTNVMGANEHIIFALITSRIPTDLLDTDIIIDTSHPDFMMSGLHKPSTIRLDHLITLRKSIIKRELGIFSLETQVQITNKLYSLLNQ